MLVLHGFTGARRACARGPSTWPAPGYTVRLPLLPGHGTSVRRDGGHPVDGLVLRRRAALGELRARCDEVFVMGLSMGATLALRLAEQRPDEVAGLVLVNASVTSQDRRLRCCRC